MTAKYQFIKAMSPAEQFTRLLNGERLFTENHADKYIYMIENSGELRLSVRHENKMIIEEPASGMNKPRDCYIEVPAEWYDDIEIPEHGILIKCIDTGTIYAVHTFDGNYFKNNSYSINVHKDYVSRLSNEEIKAFLAPEEKNTGDRNYEGQA